MKRSALIAAVCVAVFLLALGVAARQVRSSKTEIRTDRAPAAVGPYSQGIEAGGVVYCSGQLAIDAATGKIVAGGIEAETRQVLENLAAVLEAAGSSLDHAVKVTVILADIADFAAMNKVYAGFFKAPAPTRVTFQAAGLAMGARVEIDCIAVKPPVGGAR